MITITHLQPHQIKDAKYLISAVAQRIYYPEKTPEFFYDVLEEEGELRDVDNFQQAYVVNQGIFLAVLDDEKLIGTGALKRLDESTAELKRLWLLEEYHSKGIGYQVVAHLLDFARSKNYERILLQTSPEQTRAISFYKRLGFYEINCYNNKPDEISMEMRIG